MKYVLFYVKWIDNRKMTLKKNNVSLIHRDFSRLSHEKRTLIILLKGTIFPTNIRYKKRPQFYRSFNLDINSKITKDSSFLEHLI